MNDDKFYYKIAIDLLNNGTDYQKKCIKWYFDNLEEGNRMFEIRNFIDIQMKLGRV